MPEDQRKTATEIRVTEEMISEAWKVASELDYDIRCPRVFFTKVFTAMIEAKPKRGKL